LSRKLIHMTPTQRTLRQMRNEGRTCGIVEKWNGNVGPHGIRQDLFGFIDIIALDVSEYPGIIGVQCCAMSGMAAHRTKILEECHEEAELWLDAGGTIELWGWRKLKMKRGGKAMRWTPKIERITKQSFISPAEVANTAGKRG